MHLPLVCLSRLALKMSFDMYARAISYEVPIKSLERIDILKYWCVCVCVRIVLKHKINQTNSKWEHQSNYGAQTIYNNCFSKAFFFVPCWTLQFTRKTIYILIFLNELPPFLHKTQYQQKPNSNDNVKWMVSCLCENRVWALARGVTQQSCHTFDVLTTKHTLIPRIR